ncbi:hypothetical protein H2200_000942 [Cladophialophora chaetospira]|uniref:Uncharacterized protein n=1 Tax=Cladophialophora chaetospira TaxID=386627 RepID=A0AA38XPT0_9EURO|nr:hypothetical protein H2200_000942 [Cladophialophora chaetospira]
MESTSTSTSLTGLLASVLAGDATSTPPTAAEIISSLDNVNPNSTGSPVAAFSVYWPTGTPNSDAGSLTTTSGEDSADATATSGVVSITTSLDPAGYPAIATATGTTFSTSLIGSSVVATSAAPPNSTASANSTGPAAIFGHGHFGHGPGPAAIAVPMVVGTLLTLMVLTLLWRKYHPDSFHKILDAIPGLGCFARWRKTREKNKQVRRMRSLGILTGDNHGDDAPGSIGATTYHRHLKKFEDDAARAREKRSMDTPTRTPASPYTPGRKSKRTTSITALPKFGSPWKSPKPKASSEVFDTLILTASPARSTGPRVHGPYNRTYDKAETGSLASWEEKWHAFGKEERKSDSTANSVTPLHNGIGNGMQKTVGPEDESGPGQSWRKLV